MITRRVPQGLLSYSKASVGTYKVNKKPEQEGAQINLLGWDFGSIGFYPQGPTPLTKG